MAISSTPLHTRDRTGHRDATLAGGTFGAAGSARAFAARPLGALWRLSGVPQLPAWSDHPHATTARHRRGGDEHGSPRWPWARLLKRGLALDMAHCPWCPRGVLRIIGAITHEEVIRKILWLLKLSADPPPLAPARVRQEAF